MELKRCARCGSFFTSDSEVCQICNRKDTADVLRLKNFLDEQEKEIKNKEQLAIDTGISLKNINRYLNMKEFSDINFGSMKKIENKEYTELL